MFETDGSKHGCPIGKLVIEVGETHPDARRLQVENFDNGLDAVEHGFAAAIERLPAQTDPRRLAAFMLTTMQGAVMRARSYRNVEAYDAAVARWRGCAVARRRRTPLEFFDGLLTEGAPHEAHCP